MSIRTTLTVLAVAIAATAISPAVSSAAPNTGAGPAAGESEFCSTLLDRLKRFNDLANDPREPKKVRDFYKARASSVLLRAQQAGCGWAAIQGQAPPTVSQPGDVIAPGLVGARTTFDRLSASRGKRTQSSKRRAGNGGSTRVPSSQSTATALKATTTGNQQHDDYCAGVAKLINEAEAEGDRQLGLGNDAEAQAWWDLAEEFIDRATQNGCRFTLALRAQAQLQQVKMPVAARR